MDSLPRHPKQATVVIYSKDYCPYCDAAKNLVTQKGAAFEEIDLSQEPDKFAEMLEKSGQKRTVPQIFIGEQHIGGFDDLKALDSDGKLEAQLFPEGR